MRRYSSITILCLMAVLISGTAIGQPDVGKFSIGAGATQVYPSGGEMSNRFSESGISFNTSFGYVLTEKLQVILSFSYTKLGEADDLAEDPESALLDKNEFTVSPILAQLRFHPFGVGAGVTPFVSLGAGFIVWKNVRDGATTYTPNDFWPGYINYSREDVSLGYSAGLGLAGTFQLDSFFKAIQVEATAEMVNIFDDLYGAEMYGFFNIFPIPVARYNLGLRFYL